MSLFGSSKPKIIYTNASGVSTTLTFPHRTTKVENPKYKKERILHQSVLTGKRHFTEIGKHAEYNLTVFSITSSFFLECKYIDGKEVRYYPHADQEHCIVCYVEEVIPFYFNKIFMKDAIKLKLISKDFIVFSNEVSGWGYDWGYKYGH